MEISGEIMSETAISVSNLTKIYPLYDKHIDRMKEALHPFKKKYHHDFYALNDVSFEIKKGETVGIIGKNGAGKSTLLKILTGVLTPTSGNVQVNGRVSSLLELGTGFNPELTGIENIYFFGTVNGISKQEMDAKVDEIISFADIGEFIHQPVKSYSSGMFVRLAFSVTIAVDPEILIIDEALAVGDAQFQRKCYASLEHRINNGTTLLLVTHDTETVKRICKRAVFFREGEKLFDGDSVEGVMEYLRYLFPREAKVDSPIVREQKTEPEESVAPVKDEYVYRTNILNNNAEWGIGGGQITDINVYGLDAPNLLRTPCLITIEILAEWNIDFVRKRIAKEQLLPNIIIGFQLSDVRNVNLYGTNTFLENVMISPYEQASMKVCFELNLPPLYPGDMLITVAIGIGNMTNCANMHFSELASIIHNEVPQAKAGLIYFETKTRCEANDKIETKDKK